MKVRTLAGTIVTPTRISDEVQVARDGTRYVSIRGTDEHGTSLPTAISPAKAWRVREYLAGREDEG